MQLSKADACALLHISDSTMTRRIKSGQYTCTRTGEGQFAALSFTYADIGLVEPTPAPQPEPVLDVQPTVERVHDTTFTPRELSECEKKVAADEQFARDYLSGKATDSAGNTIAQKTCSLLGPRDPDDSTPAETQSHVNPALMGNTSNGVPPAPSAGMTRGGSPLAEGFSQEAYDAQMREWRRAGGRRSEGEQEVASRRAVSNIRQSFGTSPRVKGSTVR